MLRRANLETLALSETSAAGDDQPTRRTLLLTTLLASLPLALRTTAANAGVINPSETTVTLADAIHFLPWSGGPPGTGEVAEMYGGLDTPGPYLAFMRWHPGYFSAPHMYRTDRISVVVSGTGGLIAAPISTPGTQFLFRQEGMCCVMPTHLITMGSREK